MKLIMLLHFPIMNTVAGKLVLIAFVSARAGQDS